MVAVLLLAAPAVSAASAPGRRLCAETNGIVLGIECVATNLPAGVDLEVAYTLSNASPKTLVFNRFGTALGIPVGLETVVRDANDGHALKHTAGYHEYLSGYHEVLSIALGHLKPGDCWTGPFNLTREYVGITQGVYEVRARCRLPAPEGERFVRPDERVVLETPPLLVRTGCPLEELVTPYSALTNHGGMILWLHSDKTNYSLGEAAPLDLFVLITNGVSRSICGNQVTPSQSHRVFTYVVSEEATGRVLSSAPPEEDKVMAERVARSGLARSIWPITVGGVGGHQLKKFNSDLAAEYRLSRPGWYSVQARLYLYGRQNTHDIEVVLTPPLRLFLNP